MPPWSGYRIHARLLALCEVALCSGFPTQIALTLVLGQLGLDVFGPGGQLSLTGVVALLLGNVLLLVALMLYLLRQHGERPRDVFIGPRAIGAECWLGFLLLPCVLALAAAGLAAIHAFWPQLRTAPQNPFESLLDSPGAAVVFAGVAVLAGAVGEELQRAFILRRFEQHLGGGWVGLVVFSLLFGLGHQLQGWDAAIVTGLLGLVWGVLYLTRRGILPAVVSHAGFNLTQIAIALQQAGGASAG